MSNQPIQNNEPVYVYELKDLIEFTPQQLLDAISNYNLTFYKQLFDIFFNEQDFHLPSDFQKNLDYIRTLVGPYFEDLFTIVNVTPVAAIRIIDLLTLVTTYDFVVEIKQKTGLPTNDLINKKIKDLTSESVIEQLKFNVEYYYTNDFSRIFGRYLAECITINNRDFDRGTVNFKDLTAQYMKVEALATTILGKLGVSESHEKVKIDLQNAINAMKVRTTSKEITVQEQPKATKIIKVNGRELPLASDQTTVILTMFEGQKIDKKITKSLSSLVEQALNAMSKIDKLKTINEVTKHIFTNIQEFKWLIKTLKADGSIVLQNQSNVNYPLKISFEQNDEQIIINFSISNEA